MAARSGEDGEELAAEGGEEGLDGEEEDGEFEAFWGGVGAVGGGGEFFLEVGPCEAGRVFWLASCWERDGELEKKTHKEA